MLFDAVRDDPAIDFALGTAGWLRPRRPMRSRTQPALVPRGAVGDKFLDGLISLHQRIKRTRGAIRTRMGGYYGIRQMAPPNANVGFACISGSMVLPAKPSGGVAAAFPEAEPVVA